MTDYDREHEIKDVMHACLSALYYRLRLQSKHKSIYVIKLSVKGKKQQITDQWSEFGLNIN